MKKFFTIAASLLLAVGCTAPAFEENINNNESGEYDVLYAAVDDETSKVFIDENRDLSWNAGDQISVWHNTNNKPYEFQGADGDKVGEFKYQLFGGSTTQTTFSQIYALYPYDAYSKINEVAEGEDVSYTISYTIPAEQTYTEGTVAAGAAIMTAIAEAGTEVNNNKDALQFKNAMSFLRVKLYGNQTVSSVTITANNGEALAGNATISHNENNIPVLTVAEEGASSTLTLNCGEGVALDIEEATTFWLAVRPVTLATGLTVTVTTDYKEFSFPLEVENLTFERNKVNTITREVSRSIYESDLAFIQSEADSTNCVYSLSTSTNNDLAASGFKLGTSSKVGTFTSAAIGVEGEKYLNFYGAAWNDKTAELTFSVDGGTTYYQALEVNAGATGNDPYTLTVGEDQHFSIKLSDLTAESTITFSADARAILFGITLTDNALGTVITGEKPELPIIEATIAEFLAAEVSTEQWYQLTGTITSIANTTYGNFYMKDDSGSSVYVYGLTKTQVEKNDNSFSSIEGLTAGDIVTIIGTRAVYNGTAQVGGPAYYVSHVDGELPVIKGTVAEFVAATDGTVYELTGTITSVVNTDYGNFYLEDETGSVYIYGLLDAKGNKCYTSLSLNDGDTITVQGARATYSNAAQMKNATYISHVVNTTPRITSVDPEEISLSADAATKTITVTTAGEGGTLDATANEEWVGVAVDGNVVTATIEANEGEAREATITITFGDDSETVVVKQEAPVASNTEVTYTWTLASGDLSKTAGTVTKGEPAIEWSQSTATYIGWDSNTTAKGVQIGSGNKPATTFTLSTSEIKGTIKSIVVNASIAKSGDAKLTIKVGDTAYLNGQSLTTTATDYTATVNASGNIEISFAATAKAYYLKSVTITYVTE